MCDEWMPSLSLPLTAEQFRQLPRHPAYHYEFRDGQARLRPRPRFYHARLELAPFAQRAPLLPVGLRLQPAAAERLEVLAELFALAFETLQPFASLDAATRLQAARCCLERTLRGEDGPWIASASFTADTSEGAPLGAILLTLLPEGDPQHPYTYSWGSPPPPDCLARRLGQPHLTWIFVSPLAGRLGIATALLTAAAHALLGLGYLHLLSTFLLGNEASTLWHWRVGFTLLPYPHPLRRGTGSLR
jgi:GNAT superfamily N-acetyltransferase